MNSYISDICYELCELVCVCLALLSSMQLWLRACSAESCAHGQGHRVSDKQMRVAVSYVSWCASVCSALLSRMQL
jgi:hypothetical protein